MNNINTIELISRIIVFVTLVSVVVGSIFILAKYPLFIGIVVIVALIQLYIEILVKLMREGDVIQTVRVVEFTYLMGFVVTLIVSNIDKII